MDFALFFTRGLSLRQWDKGGMLAREIKLYQRTAATFRTLYFFTYGGRKDKDYQSLLPSNVVIVPKPALLPVLLYSFLLPFIHRRKLQHVAILKTNQMDGSWTAVIAKKLYGAKLIVRCGYEWLFTLRQLKKTFLKEWLAVAVERYAYNNADKIVVTSEASARFVNEQFGISLSEIDIIPNYMDTEMFVPLNMEKEKGRVIFVGRLEPEKNIDSLIKAMQGTGGHLVIIGQGSLRKKLELLAGECGVSVEFKGTVPQELLVHELNKSEVFVLSSLYEGNPKVLLEAMSCGLACIGTNVPGIRNIIDDGVDGILCNVDHDSLHNALVRVLNDQSLKSDLGALARKKIENKYSIEQILKRELSVYNALQ